MILIGVWWKFVVASRIETFEFSSSKAFIEIYYARSIFNLNEFSANVVRLLRKWNRETTAERQEEIEKKKTKLKRGEIKFTRQARCKYYNFAATKANHTTPHLISRSSFLFSVVCSHFTTRLRLLVQKHWIFFSFTLCSNRRIYKRKSKGKEKPFNCCHRCRSVDSSFCVRLVRNYVSASMCECECVRTSTQIHCDNSVDALFLNFIVYFCECDDATRSI